MGNILITEAKYVSVDGENIGVLATIEGQNLGVPIDPANRHYAEIMRQVEAGTLVIQPADQPEQSEEPNA